MRSILFLLLFIPIYVRAQQATQIVRGQIVDKETTLPLVAVNVSVWQGDKLIGGVQSDEAGEFRLIDIPLGRLTFQATYLGYKKVILPNTLVTSAKQVILKIDMESAVNEIAEVQVSSGKRKGETINEMTTLSAREFSVDEAARYLSPISFRLGILISKYLS